MAQGAEIEMHGSMFVLLKKYIETNYSNEIWIKLVQEAGAGDITYGMHQSYPASQMYSIMSGASVYAGISESNLKENFGEFLVPDLMHLYKSYVKPEWKTFEVLEYTEIVMHQAVRKEESTANPPILNISRVHDKLLIIDYYSKRKMADLAVGIIKGIAKFYGESQKVHVIPATGSNDERVQIRVEFD